MAKFVFAFESLKKLRSNKLLGARKELIEAEGRLRKVTDEHRHASMQRAMLFDERDAGKLSLGELQLNMDLIATQTQKLRHLEKSILTAQEEFDRHRNWVAHLGRELKIVEKLEENKRRTFEENERLMEKKTNDRWVAERWAQKVNQGEENNT